MVIYTQTGIDRTETHMTTAQLRQAEQQQRLVAVGADMDRLAAEARQRTGRTPARWQVREPQRPANGWRLAA